MPKRYRIHYRNAFYHVMLRGNYRQKIFYDKKDHEYFYKILDDVVNKYCCQVHLFCLMDNHVHLVIEVSDIPLSKIMQSIGAAYTKKFNSRRNIMGRLFQGKYRAKLIQDDKYLLELCYYIHMNPLNAGMVTSLDDYQWSSHCCYAGSEIIQWLTTSHLLSLLAQRTISNQNCYCSFMLNYKEEGQEPDICKLDEMGLLTVIDSVNKKMLNMPSLALENISIQAIVKLICEQLDVDHAELVSASQRKEAVLARTLVTYFAHYHAKYTLSDIGLILYRHPRSLSTTLQRYLKLVKSEAFVKNHFVAAENKLIVYRESSVFDVMP